MSCALKVAFVREPLSILNINVIRSWYERDTELPCTQMTSTVCVLVLTYSMCVLMIMTCDGAAPTFSNSGLIFHTVFYFEKRGEKNSIKCLIFFCCSYYCALNLMSCTDSRVVWCLQCKTELFALSGCMCAVCKTAKNIDKMISILIFASTVSNKNLSTGAWKLDLEIC